MDKHKGHKPGPWKVLNDNGKYEIVGPSGEHILKPGIDTSMGDLSLVADAPMLADELQIMTRAFEQSQEALQESNKLGAISCETVKIGNKRIDKLAEQNEKMLELFREILSHSHNDSICRCLRCTEEFKIRALIAEIEGEK